MDYWMDGAAKRSVRQRGQRVRASSPYSTDSNYSELPPHRPYPKSDRRRQLREHGSRATNPGGGGGAGAPPGGGDAAAARQRLMQGEFNTCVRGFIFGTVFEAITNNLTILGFFYDICF